MRERNANPCKGQIHADPRKRLNRINNADALTAEAKTLGITTAQLRQERLVSFKQTAAEVRKYWP